MSCKTNVGGGQSCLKTDRGSSLSLILGRSVSWVWGKLPGKFMPRSNSRWKFHLTAIILFPVVSMSFLSAVSFLICHLFTLTLLVAQHDPSTGKSWLCGSGFDPYFGRGECLGPFTYGWAERWVAAKKSTASRRPIETPRTYKITDKNAPAPSVFAGVCCSAEQGRGVSKRGLYFVVRVRRGCENPRLTRKEMRS